MTPSRAKFFIDENTSPELAPLLNSIFKAHLFRTADAEGLRGVEDTDLFRDLRNREFDAIITADARQLVLPEERAGLLAAGLHWIGYGMPTGARGASFVAHIVSAVAPGMGHVLADWRDVPSLYHLKAPRRFEEHAPTVEPL